MRRTIPLVCIGLFLTAAATPALAQQRLFAHIGEEVVEIDPRAASLGTVIRRFPLPAESGAVSKNDIAPLLGGEFLVWVSQPDRQLFTQDVVLLNTRSGAVQRFMFPDFRPNQVIGTDGNSRLLLLGKNGSGHDVVLVADERSGSTRFLDLGTLDSTLPYHRPIAYAAASHVLFVAKPRSDSVDSYHDVDVIDAGTGALLKTLDIWPVSAYALSANVAGTRLYVSDVKGAFAFDVVTGTQFASATPDAFGTIDERRNRLIAHRVVQAGATPEQWRLRGISAFSADSLQFIGRVQVPEPPLPPETPEFSPYLTEQLDISGLSATIFVMQAVREFQKYYFGPCHESQIIALDADTGQVRRTVNTTATLGACGGYLVRVTEPLPPLGLSAEVAGHQVKLAWRPPFGATRYELEAGSAPGLANLATIPVTDTQLVVDGVPSGTYHLRVRAINTIGKSAASQDIQVVVP